ncbi:MAG: hypothetical protein ACSLFM_10980 [Tepidiformaceae bacterium]
MQNEDRYPNDVTVYEAIRTHPGSLARLGRIGLTRDHFDYSLSAAARELRVPVERLTSVFAPT